MQESVNRFKKTINSLTDVVKLQQENSADAVLVNLNEVLEEVCLDLDPMIKASEAEWEIEVEEEMTIHFSEKNLKSVIYNLLSNAIIYRSPARLPHIKIKGESRRNFHMLTFSDNGLGIDAPTDQLFKMFKRFHDHVEGTGIGLYMVKKMVENAGGYIEAETKVGVGTTFRVFFKRRFILCLPKFRGTLKFYSKG